MMASDSDSEDDFTQTDPQLPSFTVPLYLTGDANSSFRTTNDPLDPLQRGTYFEQTGAIDIRCESIDVVHGLFSPQAQSFATLIILDFRFDSRKNARRISSVHVELKFADMDTENTGPEVVRIAPDKALSLMPTAFVETTTRKGELAVGAGAIATATGTVGWEKSVSKNMLDETKVTGSIDLRGRTYGKKNTATWTLLENPTTKTGVPRSMRTAILLKRKDERPFRCLVTLKSTADFKTSMERVFGKTPPNDPVLFDPELPPTNNLQEYDVENLGAFDLEGTSDLTFSTILTTAIKEKSLKGTGRPIDAKVLPPNYFVGEEA